MREFLKGLELDETVINKIMAEYGKSIESYKAENEKYKSDIEGYKTKLDEYKTKVNELTDKSKDSAKVQEELEALKNQIAEREQQEQARKDDELLTNNILQVFGDKQFVNEYTKNAIINDIKTGLKNADNTKSAKDLFEEMTKDKSDIFANPNKMPDMAGMEDSEESINKKEVPKMW